MDPHYEIQDGTKNFQLDIETWWYRTSVVLVCLILQIWKGLRGIISLNQTNL